MLCRVNLDPIRANMYIHRSIDRFVTREWDIDVNDVDRTILYDGTVVDFDLLTVDDEQYIKITLCKDHHIVHSGFVIATESAIWRFFDVASVSWRIFNKINKD